MTKMPEPVGCGYVVRWERGDTPSTYKTGYARVLGVDVFTTDQLKQAMRDALESAAVEMQGLYTYGGDDVAAVIRAMKEAI